MGLYPFDGHIQSIHSKKPINSAKLFIAILNLDPEFADLLFAYAKNHHQNHRPKSLIAEAPFLNRSKTVPVIKFRYRPSGEEEKEEERGNNFEKKRKEPEENGTLLSPVSRSQNLLQEAINSLDNQQQNLQNFEAIKVEPKNNNNSFASAELFEGDFRGKIEK